MINLVRTTFHEVGTIILPVSQLRSMKEKEVQQFVQDHRLISGRASNTDNLAPEPTHLRATIQLQTT